MIARLLLALLATGACADWALDNEASSLSFVTVKAGDVAEVHHFRSLSGEAVVDHDPLRGKRPPGQVAVQIDLASVDTLIPIRDERMREHLFGGIPAAYAYTTVDVPALKALAAGESLAAELPVRFVFGENEIPLRADVLVTRLGEDAVLVATRKPVVVNAGSIGLVAGVEKLRELAGLPSISKAVPVTFVLTFRG